MPGPPPIVPGLTAVPGSQGPSDLLPTLANQAGGGPPTTGMSLLRQAISELRQVAGTDPRLSERIAKAIATIEGSDDASAQQRQSGGRDQNRIGPMLGNAKTPI